MLFSARICAAATSVSPSSIRGRSNRSSAPSSSLTSKNIGRDATQRCTIARARSLCVMMRTQSAWTDRSSAATAASKRRMTRFSSQLQYFSRFFGVGWMRWDGE
jgi:hypothetical protein